MVERTQRERGRERDGCEACSVLKVKSLWEGGVNSLNYNSLKVSYSAKFTLSLLTTLCVSILSVIPQK